MKNLKLISAAILMVISSSAFAEDHKNEIASKSTLKAPVMEWGNPEDVNSNSVKSLKFISFSAPSMEWGNPEDVNSETVNDLKLAEFSNPEMEWGNPEDVNAETVQSLKDLK